MQMTEGQVSRYMTDQYKSSQSEGKREQSLKGKERNGALMTCGKSQVEKKKILERNKTSGIYGLI